MPSYPCFSLEINWNWKSRFPGGMLQSLSRKDHSPSHAFAYKSTIRPGNLFLEYCISCLARIPFKRWKISSFFSMSSCSSCLYSSSLQALQEFVMSRCHTWIYSWCEKKVVFFNFFVYFCSFRWFHFGCFVSLFRVLVHALIQNPEIN